VNFPSAKNLSVSRTAPIFILFAYNTSPFSPIKNSVLPPPISINKTFLEALATEDDSLIDTVIHLLYFYSTLDQNTELFQQFIINNYDKLQQIYTINQQIQNSHSNFILNLKNKVLIKFIHCLCHFECSVAE